LVICLTISKRPHELPDQIVKERFAVDCCESNRAAVELACLSEEGVFYALPGGCQSLFFSE